MRQCHWTLQDTHYIRAHYQDTESKQLYLIHRNKHRKVAKRGDKETKELNKMEVSNLSDAEFKTLVIRMLKELSEDLSSIKKTQSEMEGTLIAIKNHLQGHTIEWMKPRIKSMIWNIGKQKTTNENNKKKKELKK